MSQSSEDKSINDKVEDGLSSFIDKARTATSEFISKASDATSQLVSSASDATSEMAAKAKSAIVEDDDAPGYNAPAELDNPLEQGNEEGLEGEVAAAAAAAAVEEKREEVILKLGDVIYIVDPTNEILNDSTFIIEYIDPKKIKLVNIKSFDKTQLRINPDGVIGEGTITEIKLLSRNSDEGFALQNGLVPGKWVNIYFGGDFPTVITGEITNL